MSAGDHDVERRMEAVAAELRRRAQTVHERVACPKCAAPVGARCRAMPRGYPRPGHVLTALYGREVKHPHRERLRADGIPDR